jgi:hypothetical protein
MRILEQAVCNAESKLKVSPVCCSGQYDAYVIFIIVDGWHKDQLNQALFSATAHFFIIIFGIQRISDIMNIISN